MKPLLIGQAPGPNTDPELPLFPVPSTSAGGRLADIMGLTRGEYLNTFERTNVLREFPGKYKRDDKFPLPQARLAATAIKPLLANRDVIIVGRNVATVFDLSGDFHVWQEWQVRRRCAVSKDAGICRVAIVPHPSGRNHWYNSKENRELAHRFWQEFLNKT